MLDSACTCGNNLDIFVDSMLKNYGKLNIKNVLLKNKKLTIARLSQSVSIAG